MRTITSLVVVAALAAPLVALDRAADDAVARLRSFLVRLKHHEVDLYEPVENGIPVPDGVDAKRSRLRYYRSDEIDRLQTLLTTVATSGHSDTHTLLMQCATFRPEPDPGLERRRWRAEQPWLVRRLATEAFVACTDPATDGWLVRMTLDDRGPRDAELRRELSTRILARRGSVSNAPAIAGRLSDDSPRVRAAAARALGELGVTAEVDRLLAAAGDPDATVRLECILALEALAEADRVGALRERLRKTARAALEDPHWTVRLAGARLVATTHDPAGIPALVRALEREQPEVTGSRYRVRSTIRDALGTLSGEDFSSVRPDQWAEWWAAAAPTFEPPTEPKLPAIEQGARFAGIPIESDRVLFLIDASGSMRQPKPDDKTGPARWQIAIREFERCAAALRTGTLFNVVLFNERRVALAPVPVALDESVLARASQFVRAAEPGGGTDLLAALELAFGQDADRVFERGKTFDVDTVVLLTDGMPSRGAVLVPEQILFEVAEANRSRAIAIHTIDTAGVMNEFLAALASQNHGSHAGL